MRINIPFKKLGINRTSLISNDLVFNCLINLLVSYCKRAPTGHSTRPLTLTDYAQWSRYSSYLPLSKSF